MMTFKKHNLNPRHKTSDCVVRAIAFALNKRWEEVYGDLVELGLRVYSMPNSPEVYGYYLEHYPTIPVMHETPNGKKRYTVKEICKWKGTYVVSIANHLTVVKDNICYDTFDCTDRSSYKIWKVKE